MLSTLWVVFLAKVSLKICRFVQRCQDRSACGQAFHQVAGFAMTSVRDPYQNLATWLSSQALLCRSVYFSNRSAVLNGRHIVLSLWLIGRARVSVCYILSARPLLWSVANVAYVWSLSRPGNWSGVVFYSSRANPRCFGRLLSNGNLWHASGHALSHTALWVRVSSPPGHVCATGRCTGPATIGQVASGFSSNLCVCSNWESPFTVGVQAPSGEQNRTQIHPLGQHRLRGSRGGGFSGVSVSGVTMRRNGITNAAAPDCDTSPFPLMRGGSVGEIGITVGQYVLFTCKGGANTSFVHGVWKILPSYGAGRQSSKTIRNQSSAVFIQCSTEKPKAASPSALFDCSCRVVTDNLPSASTSSSSIAKKCRRSGACLAQSFSRPSGPFVPVACPYSR